jgi:hypothetical protein
MRGSPRQAAPEHRAIASTPPKPRAQATQPERVSTSPYAKPKILMGEVAAPTPKFAASGGGGQEIGRQRDAFRAFMLARRLRPTAWARAAGIPSGEILAFLSGNVRSIAPETAAKLAQAAGCAPEDLFAASSSESH